MRGEERALVRGALVRGGLYARPSSSERGFVQSEEVVAAAAARVRSVTGVFEGQIRQVRELRGADVHVPEPPR